ncbi:MAG TPA: hypothetical protein VNT99_04520 [Methylomirabilota bacterium]|nr:hypothetical protein [Methylomirabilota bacterium]
MRTNRFTRRDLIRSTTIAGGALHSAIPCLSNTTFAFGLFLEACFKKLRAGSAYEGCEREAAAVAELGRWTKAHPMKALVIILLVLATGCHAQDTNGITSKVFERDSDKDGKPELRVETVYRDGTKVMLIWSKPDAQGVLRVSSRSYFAGGDMVSTESDEDRDGFFETIAVYRAGTTDMEVFIRQQHGLVIPASGQTLAAYKKQNAAIVDFFDKAFESGTGTDKAMELMDEAQRKIQAAEKEIADGKK